MSSSEALTADLAASSDALDRVIADAQADAWHETVEAIVANLQASQGTIAETAWQEEWTTLLETVRLEALVTAPFLKCCNLNPVKNAELPEN
jgi:hypothetical protein